MKNRIKLLFRLIVILSLLIAVSCSDDDSSTKPNQVASPVFSPLSGTYSTFLEITIYCQTTESIIRYTTDGSEPTDLSQLYYTPINIQTDTIIKARAFKQDASPSEIATAEYELELPTVATLSFSPTAGTYNYSQDILITCPTPDVEIYYTLDESQPTELSELYSTPINISTDTIIKAKAYKTNYYSSEIAMAEYFINFPLPNIPNPADNSINISLTPTLSWEIPVAEKNKSRNITFDVYLGTSDNPELVSINQTEYFYLPAELTGDTNYYWKVVVKDGELEVASSVWTFNTIHAPETPANPYPENSATGVILNPTLTWESSVSKMLKSRNLTYDVYFGRSNNPPLVIYNQLEQSYTPAVLPAELTEGTSYYWKVVARDGELEVASPVWSFTTGYSATDTVANPIFNPIPGFYDEGQFVEISSTTSNANIYYTLDGSEPTELSQLYNNPITISISKTIKARGFKNNHQASEIVIGEYTINADFIPGFVYVASGTFNNGTAYVALSSYYISRYELTQAEYQAVMGTNPSSFSGADKPVEQVTWLEAVQYCNARSIEEGLIPCYNESDWSCNFSANGYRLPTEMEWMYAAKGGNQQPPSGFNEYAGTDEESQLTNYAWYSANNSPTGTKDVGFKIPNELGLYDMSGNVWEWCYDWYGDYSNATQVNPVGPSTGSRRVIRGGAWSWSATNCRVAKRYSSYPDDNEDYTGFRLVRSSD